ncbi:YggT family protein [Candidatus Nitrotoga sp. 1052]|uniref:YggT family protein n=1 Tax=Candidatus Nitrotoga sp. 1052 TaxID=2886964 RepID=UPI001EF5FAC4|nr:YggT family protein [Candidatus Nitrotoga sp. 1052]CAH1082266.1 YggT family protein [Candidatus Nitrotoga sp. 1052]
MLSEALQFLFDTLLQPFAVILLLRFHLQWLRAPMRNPLGAFIMTLTNFLVLRARRFIPSAWGFDIATLLLAFVVEAIYLAATLWLQGLPIDFPVLGLLMWTAVKLLKLSLYLLMAALFIQALLSWFNPHSPMAGLMAAVTQPFLRPLQRRIPPFGNIDFTLLLLLIVCQLILIVPLRWLESLVLSLF